MSGTYVGINRAGVAGGRQKLLRTGVARVDIIEALSSLFDYHLASATCAPSHLMFN